MKNTIATLSKFIGKNQVRVMIAACANEEAAYFQEVMQTMAKVFDEMPKTYEQDGFGDLAVAHLHYFLGGMNWYITEKDCESEQLQAFGLADLGMGAELGYISIEELIENGVEIDLHWTPKTLAEIKKGE